MGKTPSGAGRVEFGGVVAAVVGAAALVL